MSHSSPINYKMVTSLLSRPKGTIEFINKFYGLLIPTKPEQGFTHLHTDLDRISMDTLLHLDQ